MGPIVLSIAGGREERADTLSPIVLHSPPSSMLRLPIHWGLASDVGITFFESVSRKNYKELLENLKISLLYPYIWLEWETHVGSPSESENKTSASIYTTKR